MVELFSNRIITCWEEIRRAFLREFFTDERYWEVRKHFAKVHANHLKMLGEDSEAMNLNVPIMVIQNHNFLTSFMEVLI